MYEDKPDYSLLVMESMFSLSKEWSLEQCARKLNVNKSSVYAWRNQRSKPTWSHFFKLLLLKNKSTMNITNWKGVPLHNGSLLIEKFVKDHTFDNVLVASGLTKNGLSKLISKRAETKVETIFKIWDHLSRYNFLCFLYSIVELKDSDWFDPISQKWSKEIELSKEYPYFAGVIMSFGNGLAIKGLSESLAERFNTSVSKISTLLSTLEKNNFIEIDKEIIKFKDYYYFNSSIHYPTYKNLALYWSKQALEKFSNDIKESNFTTCNYALLRLDESLYKEIQLDIANLYIKARKMSDSSQASNGELTTLTLQFLKLD
jgi:predicted transcriptional regulator